MKSFILQYSTNDTPEQKELLNISTSINQPYSKKYNFEYIISNIRRCPERSVFYETIAWLNEFLHKINDGDLVVYEDTDCLNIGNEDLHDALNGILGMVKMLNCITKKPLNWYNSGVMIIINNNITREFFRKVWNNNNVSDEAGINNELKINKIASDLNIKWNCWKNNISLCKNPVIRAFHALKPHRKIKEMKEFLQKT